MFSCCFCRTVKEEEVESGVPAASARTLFLIDGKPAAQKEPRQCSVTLADKEFQDYLQKCREQIAASAVVAMYTGKEAQSERIKSLTEEELTKVLPVLDLDTTAGIGLYLLSTLSFTISPLFTAEPL
jgi:hypothetical protein